MSIRRVWIGCRLAMNRCQGKWSCLAMGTTRLARLIPSGSSLKRGEICLERENANRRSSGTLRPRASLATAFAFPAPLILNLFLFRSRHGPAIRYRLLRVGDSFRFGLKFLAHYATSGLGASWAGVKSATVSMTFTTSHPVRERVRFVFRV